MQFRCELLVCWVGCVVYFGDFVFGFAVCGFAVSLLFCLGVVQIV